MPPRVSLRDLARRAGVHVSTVSLALRGHPKISEATRQRIRALAEKLGYVRDPSLDALIAYRNEKLRPEFRDVFAYVTSWGDTLEAAPHHRLFIAGARERARLLGYRLDFFSLREPGMSAARLSNLLKARGIRGLIISTFQDPEDRLELEWSEFSAVRVELQPRWPPLHSICVDHASVVREAVRRVVEFGYKRPGFVLAENWNAAVDGHWLMGYQWAQLSCVQPEHRIPAFEYYGLHHGTRRRYRFKGWFEAHRPDVLLGPSAPVFERLADLGLEVPRDVAFADCFLEEPRAGIAGVVHPLAEVGALAVDTLAGLLLQNVRGIPPQQVSTSVVGRWVDGASCPPARQR
ncbi:LacI family DNA-binding transcriptional regulator [Nibricoccus sp. IMCC34717]|uniref:LacI family DNA-binding transcriptional regulator n=1 Tax=Nibricoccus sp. IMCC34717 TaxID=3034021 RepID=UPI00384FB077